MKNMEKFFFRKVSAAAHTIAEFAHRALSGNLPHSGSRSPSYLVVGSFVFVCRQIYNTCDGLVLLKEYRLHESISRAWKQVYFRMCSCKMLCDDISDSSIVPKCSILIKLSFIPFLFGFFILLC